MREESVRMIGLSLLAFLLLLGCIAVVVKKTNEPPVEHTVVVEMDAGAGKLEHSMLQAASESVVFEEPEETTKEITADEEPAAASSEEEVAEEDPYGIYVTSENWAREYDGLAVERGGKLYTLCNVMPSSVITDYGCGFQWGTVIEDGPTPIYIQDNKEITSAPTEASKAWISVGDFPIFYVNQGEELRAYSNHALESIKINKADFYGYTIPASGQRAAYFPIMDFLYCRVDEDVVETNVLDLAENPVADVRKLEYGQGYTFEWYEGTNYHSKIFDATSRCYVVDEDPIEVPVQRTKNGYGVVDLSGLEPGTYVVGTLLGFFELKP